MTARARYRKKWSFTLAFAAIALAVGLTRILSGVVDRDKSRHIDTSQLERDERSAFTDGLAWTRLESSIFAPEEAILLKNALVRVSLDSSFAAGWRFEGQPLSTERYVTILNDLYAHEENKKVPLLFAMNLAQMDASGASFGIMLEYRRRIIEQLERRGLL